MSRRHAIHRPADWRLLPATKTLAFYDSLAHYIELSEVDSAALVAAVSQIGEEPLKASLLKLSLPTCFGGCFLAFFEYSVR